jgi:hypothetical protein
MIMYRTGERQTTPTRSIEEEVFSVPAEDEEPYR